MDKPTSSPPPTCRVCGQEFTDLATFLYEADERSTCSPKCEDIRKESWGIKDELKLIEMQWESAKDWAIGQSFGSWASHGCAGPPPWNDDGFTDRLCKDCRAVHDLGVEFRDEFLQQT